MRRLGLSVPLAVLALPASLAPQKPPDPERLAPVYAGGAARIPADKPARMDASGDEVMTVKYPGGSWSLSYTRMRTLYVSLSRPSELARMVLATGGATLPWLFINRKSYLSIRYEDAEGVSRNVYFYVPPGGGAVLDTLAAKAHLNVVFESHEARRQIAGMPAR